jgi:hypothetical protein
VETDKDVDDLEARLVWIDEAEEVAADDEPAFDLIPALASAKSRPATTSRKIMAITARVRETPALAGLPRGSR